MGKKKNYYFVQSKKKDRGSNCKLIFSKHRASDSQHRLIRDERDTWKNDRRLFATNVIKIIYEHLNFLCNLCLQLLPELKNPHTNFVACVFATWDTRCSKRFVTKHTRHKMKNCWWIFEVIDINPFRHHHSSQRNDSTPSTWEAM